VIADDDPGIREMIMLVLEGRNLRFLQARTGVEALELIQRELPRLVLLDVQMPGLDGVTVCRLVRADDRLADTRVVIITAQDDMRSIHQGQEAGPDVYLTKPFGSVQLREVVDALLT